MCGFLFLFFFPFFPWAFLHGNSAFSGEFPFFFWSPGRALLLAFLPTYLLHAYRGSGRDIYIYVYMYTIIITIIAWVVSGNDMG